jgi:hypothetical protein
VAGSSKRAVDETLETWVAAQTVHLMTTQFDYRRNEAELDIESAINMAEFEADQRERALVPWSQSHKCFLFAVRGEQEFLDDFWSSPESEREEFAQIRDRIQRAHERARRHAEALSGSPLTL